MGEVMSVKVIRQKGHITRLFLPFCYLFLHCLPRHLGVRGDSQGQKSCDNKNGLHGTVSLEGRKGAWMLLEDGRKFARVLAREL